MEIAVNLAFLVILIDAFHRLNKLVRHEGLALSKPQMFFHVSAFAVTAVTATVFMCALIRFQIHSTNLVNASWRFNTLDILGQIFIFGMFLASFTLLLILNSLLNKEINNRLNSGDRDESALVSSDHNSI
jgi:hypothetical protein